MRVALATSVLLLAAASAPARAQIPEPPARPSDEDVAVAREAFLRGLEHARGEAWGPAAAEFLRSYRQSGSPVALLNAGTSLSRLGRHRDATEALLRVLDDPSFDEATREALRGELAEASRHVTILILHGLPGEGARWSLDGVDQGRTRRQPLTVVLDPGPHEVEVAVDGYAPWRWPGPARAGQRVERNVPLERALIDEPPGREAEDPTPWILLAVGVLAAAAGLVLGLWLDANAQLGPRSPFVIELP